MGFPVLGGCGMFLVLLLLSDSLFVVFVVQAGHDIELFGVVLDQILFPLHWQSHLSVVEVEIR